MTKRNGTQGLASYYKPAFKDLERSCGQYSVTNCRCDVSFEDRCGDFRRSMYRPSKIVDRCHDVSTFVDRCVDLRRSMC